MSLEMEEYVSDQMPEDMQKNVHLWTCTVAKMEKCCMKVLHLPAIRIKCRKLSHIFAVTQNSGLTVPKL
jgi:hypothetical protein